jgi:hypothetical protein
MDEWFDAYERRDLEEMRRLLAEGIDVDVAQEGMTALMLATQAGDFEIVRFLVKNGADVNLRESEYGTTPLMFAAEGHAAVVLFLLERGADVNAKDKGGSTPLSYARRTVHPDVADVLRRAGAQPEIPRTVLVLGAGFTRAFVPKSPLLIDDYNVEPTLTARYARQRAAHDILKQELRRNTGGKVDLERLMTRLAGGMPYDRGRGVEAILAALLGDLKDHFLRKLEEAVQGERHLHELLALALQCVKFQVDTVTFNYDVVWDEALWDCLFSDPKLGWSPNTGYGFYCAASETTIGMPGGIGEYDNSSVQVLKLHGSSNWHVRHGTRPPYRIEDVVHHEDWYLSGSRGRDEHGNHINRHHSRSQHKEMIERQIDRQPMIVPPVLAKTDLNEHPILRAVWHAAYEALANAERIIFVGYSLPITDINAASLFGEATPLHPKYPEVQVVGFAADDDNTGRSALKASYRRVFPDLPDSQFRFDGAREWAKDFIGEGT